MTRERKQQIVTYGICYYAGLAAGIILGMGFMPDTKPVLIIFIVISFVLYAVFLWFLYFKKTKD